MRWASRLTLIAAAATLALCGWTLHSGAIRPAQPRATIEPTLPLTIDLGLEQVAVASPGGHALLRGSMTTDRPIRDLVVRLVLPEGIEAEAGGTLEVDGASLQPGERRAALVGLRAARRAALPIRVDATFRLADGRTLRASHGLTLDLGAGRPPGRSHAGAYEVMAVPLEDLRR